ncbi:hypothetical protein GQ457_04G019100 [Hibiscus cannabinus]
MLPTTSKYPSKAPAQKLLGLGSSELDSNSGSARDLNKPNRAEQSQARHKKLESTVVIRQISCEGSFGQLLQRFLVGIITANVVAGKGRTAGVALLRCEEGGGFRSCFDLQSFIMVHRRRWKEERFFNKANKIFDVETILTDPPKESSRNGKKQKLPGMRYWNKDKGKKCPEIYIHTNDKSSFK